MYNKPLAHADLSLSAAALADEISNAVAARRWKGAHIWPGDGATVKLFHSRLYSQRRWPTSASLWRFATKCWRTLVHYGAAGLFREFGVPLNKNSACLLNFKEFPIPYISSRRGGGRGHGVAGWAALVGEGNGAWQWLNFWQNYLEAWLQLKTTNDWPSKFVRIVPKE